jgi:hypothetical protein
MWYNAVHNCYKCINHLHMKAELSYYFKYKFN